MRAEQLVREGNLQKALMDLQEQIRKQPENPQYRSFLFQLLAILGHWDRALNQLKVMSDLNVGSLALLHIYSAAIECETLRREIFAGRCQPMILGAPPEWMAKSLESMRLMGEGRFDLAVAMRNEAFGLAPESSGAINGKPFAWIADADSTLGPVLEVILSGRYYWVPFQQVKAITAQAPKDLCDLVWLPAQFTWANGGQAHGLIPARYVGSEGCSDSAVQLGRKTEWVERAEGVSQGLGQRMLATDQEEYPLLDVREITIE